MFIEDELYRQDMDNILSVGLDWNRLIGKTILVTGATGMIGTVLVDALLELNRRYQKNISVIAVGRSKERLCARFANENDEGLHFFEADVNYPFDIPEKIDYVFHCASNTHPRLYATDPVGTVLTNITGTAHVLDCALKSRAERTVFLSSVEIYGENKSDKTAFSEEDCGYIDCNTLRAGYPEGKRAGEALCQAYRKQFGLDVVIPRICRVYGPTILNTDSKALSQFIRNALEKNDIVLKSAGQQLYSYCYVADVVAALFVILLNGEDGQAYNIADEQSDVRLKDLANIIAECSGTNVVFELPDAVESLGFSKATTAVLDSSKLRKLGWKAQESIKTGIEKTLALMERIC